MGRYPARSGYSIKEQEQPFKVEIRACTLLLDTSIKETIFHKYGHKLNWPTVSSEILTATPLVFFDTTFLVKTSRRFGANVTRHCIDSTRTDACDSRPR